MRKRAANKGASKKTQANQPGSPHAHAITEQRNPRSRHLDKMSVKQLVRLFVEEEKWVQQALHLAEPSITKACVLISERLQKKGRLFYLGAGTSGRLGVLDASEMPPTFNVSPDLVQGLIAGGFPALTRSQEGAEDDPDAAGRELSLRKLTSKDVVVGISANGHAPYVLGGLRYAKSKKAATIRLTCNPNRLPCKDVDLNIDLETGPELIAGSTRLKAGTATKLVLNMLSSIAMIRGGRVKDNLMINVQPTNAKLRERAIRLVTTLNDCSPEDAQNRLEQSEWNVARAIQFSE